MDIRRLQRYLLTGVDDSAAFSSLKKHDDEYHGGNYTGGRCKYRERQEKSDDPILQGLNGGTGNGIIPAAGENWVRGELDRLASGERVIPRFTKEEVKASYGKQHEKLWEVILSLESSDINPGGTGKGKGGAGGDDSQGGGGLGLLRRMATRYGSDPKDSVKGEKGRFIDRGIESSVYRDGIDSVVKVRKLSALGIDGVKDALARIVYHNYLFPKDAYTLRDIAVWKNDSGFDDYYLLLEQQFVEPKTEADGTIVEPTCGQIQNALSQTPQKFQEGRLSEPEAETSGEDRKIAYNGHFIVSDFQPGRNTFIDSKTGEVRFIDPRISLNDPAAGFAVSRFGERNSLGIRHRFTEEDYDDIAEQYEEEERLREEVGDSAIDLKKVALAAIAEDAEASAHLTDLQKHDMRFHPDGGYKEGDSCKYREAMSELDGVDDLTLRTGLEEAEADESKAADEARAKKEYADVVAKYSNPDGTMKDGWMKAPNGEKSNLSKDQWIKVRTPSFIRRRLVNDVKSHYADAGGGGLHGGGNSAILQPNATKQRRLPAFLPIHLARKDRGRFSALIAEALGFAPDRKRVAEIGLDVLRKVFEASSPDGVQRRLFEKVAEVAGNLGVDYRVDWKPIANRAKEQGYEFGGHVYYHADALDKAKKEEIPATILHEMIHGVTSYAIDISENAAGVEGVSMPHALHDSVRRLRKCYNESKRRIGGEYGEENLHEFVAELSNRRFRDKLRGVGLLKRTYNSIVGIFRSLTGWGKTASVDDEPMTETEKALVSILDNADNASFAAHRRAADLIASTDTSPKGTNRMNLREIADAAIAEDAAGTAKLFLTSDLHTTDIDALDPKDAEIVVIAGDIMGGGMDSDEAGFRFLEKEFFPWCREHADKEIVLTAGNHDKFLFRQWLKGKRLDWPKNVHYLVDKGATIRGIRFYGTPWCLKDRPGRFEGTEESLKDQFARIPTGVDVLISHCPPYIPGKGVDANNEGLHEGSKELTEAILDKRPRICVCGHVHSGSRRPAELGATTVYNVSRVDSDRSEEAYSPRFISVARGGRKP